MILSNHLPLLVKEKVRLKLAKQEHGGRNSNGETDLQNEVGLVVVGYSQ